MNLRRYFLWCGSNPDLLNGIPSGGIDNMTRTFLIADITIAVVLGAAEAIVLVRYFKKKTSPAD